MGKMVNETLVFFYRIELMLILCYVIHVYRFLKLVKKIKGMLQLRWTPTLVEGKNLVVSSGLIIDVVSDIILFFFLQSLRF